MTRSELSFYESQSGPCTRSAIVNKTLAKVAIKIRKFCAVELLKETTNESIEKELLEKENYFKNALICDENLTQNTFFTIKKKES